jgi:hypothetical protein
MTTTQLAAPVRNATLETLADMLMKQDAAKLDIATPIVNLRMQDGVATIAGTSVFDDGQRYLPTAIADGHLAEKLGIDRRYLRRMRDERIDLYDLNVNGWIHGNEALTPDPPTAGPDPRTVTLRLFQGDPGQVGVMRAMLSDRYGIIDNLDVTLAALQGMKDAGVETEILGCDLNENRMMIKVAAPNVFAKAPHLTDGYRSPFQGKNLPEWARQKFGVDGDGVFAGFVITNSETGGGAFNIVPRITVLTCLNGMMRTKDAMRKIHIGSKMEEGVITWSDETYRRQLELISAQTTDAVQTFLSQGYLTKAVDDLSEKAGVPIDGNAADAITVVTKQVGFTDTQRDGILDHFIRGGQMTAGGVMQAVTSFAQEMEDADAAYDMEAAALRVLELAAAL